MIRFLFVLTISCGYWWTLYSVHGKKIPADYPYGPKPDLSIMDGPIPDSCPDECIYSKECGMDNYTAGRPHWDVFYVANGSGLCYSLYGLDSKFCPIKTDGECMIKCGGAICAEEKNFHDMSEDFEEPLEVKLRAYRRLNDTSQWFVWYCLDTDDSKYCQYTREEVEKWERNKSVATTTPRNG